MAKWMALWIVLPKFWVGWPTSRLDEIELAAASRCFFPVTGWMAYLHMGKIK